VELPYAGGFRGWWLRLNPLPRVFVILSAVMLPLFLCCGGVAVLGALSADPEQEPTDANAQEPVVVTESASPSATVVTRIVTETEEIPFEEEVVEDPSLLEGAEEVRTEGVTGELTVTFEVTYTNGEETDRRKLDEEVTREPVNEVIVVGTGQPEPEPEPEPEEDAGSNCHPDYSGVCVPAGVSDVDCAGGSGNGPAYVRGPVYIEGGDPYDLDRDGDGVACE
jgi:resuscitation-promoting factor RpfB